MELWCDRRGRGVRWPEAKRTATAVVRHGHLARAPMVVPSHGRSHALWASRPGKWGASRLTTTGRRSGEPRSVIIGYFEDGPNLISMAMNGWGASPPGG